MALNFCKQGENFCRFTGKLNSFSVNLVGNDKYVLGKGVIFLPDPDNEKVGQNINIMAWGDKAESLKQIVPEDWIVVYSSYTPSVYKGYIQDYFTVTDFIKL